MELRTNAWLLWPVLIFAAIWAALWSAAPLRADSETAAEAVIRCRANAGVDAIANCQRASDAEPQDRSLQRALGAAQVRWGDPDAALAVFRSLAESAPQNADAQYDYAAMAGFTARWDEARRAVDVAVALRGTHLPTLRLAVLVNEAVGDRTKSFGFASRGADLGDPVALYDVAVAYREGRGTATDPARCVQFLERAAAAGHVGAMQDLSEVFLEGLLGQRADSRRAEEWAAAARATRLAR